MRSSLGLVILAVAIGLIYAGATGQSFTGELRAALVAPGGESVQDQLDQLPPAYRSDGPVSPEFQLVLDCLGGDDTACENAQAVRDAVKAKS